MDNKEFLEYLKVVKGVNTSEIGLRSFIENSKIDAAKMFTRLSKIRDDIDENIAIISLVSFHDWINTEIEALLYYLSYLNKIFIFTDKEWDDLITEVFHELNNSDDMEESIKELMNKLVISSKYTSIRGEDYLILGDKFYKLKV